MSAEFVFEFQVIPSLLGQPVNGEEKPPKAFAYVSVEDINVQEKKAKALLGQIRKCNLTKSRMLGEKVILGKVQHLLLFYILLLLLFIYFCMRYIWFHFSFV